MTRYYMDLICWQKAMDLVTEIYRLTKQLPKEEVFGLAANFVEQRFLFQVILQKARDVYPKENFAHF